MARILLVDDDPAFSGFVRSALEAHGQQVDYLESAHGAIELLSQTEYDLVLLDNRMPGLSGIELLAALKQRGVSVPVILMTGDPTSQTAIQAMNLGAFDYVVKPLELDELVAELAPLIVKAEQIVESTKQHVRLPGDTVPGDGPQLLGNSRPMQEVYKLIGKVAGTSDPVIIMGETGTGKEIVARAIHAHGPRKQKPFVTVNCSSLVEDDLFGHEPGAFQGAEKLRKGWFEYANGGTLFLDEISDLPPPLQARLLPILKTNQFLRAGGSEPIAVDVRIVSATSRDLAEAIRAGQFREDLFYRLSGVAIRVPPLRERGADLPLLVNHCLARLAHSTARPVPTLAESAWEKLRAHDWPGNIWQLQNVLGRALLVAKGQQIGTADLELEAPGSPEGDVVAFIHRAISAAVKTSKSNLIALVRRIVNRELLVAALTEAGGDQEKAERLLGGALDTLMEEDGPGPRGGGAKAKPLSFQVEALLLIAENPDWTAAEIAEALGCSRSKLYRDPLVQRALKARTGDSKPLSRGPRSGEDDLGADVE